MEEESGLDCTIGLRSLGVVSLDERLPSGVLLDASLASLLVDDSALLSGEHLASASGFLSVTLVIYSVTLLGS